MNKAEKEIQDILKKHNLKIGYKLDFPRYKILPDEVQLALKVLANNGLKISFVLDKTKA